MRRRVERSASRQLRRVVAIIRRSATQQFSTGFIQQSSLFADMPAETGFYMRLDRGVWTECCSYCSLLCLSAAQWARCWGSTIIVAAVDFYFKLVLYS